MVLSANAKGRIGELLTAVVIESLGWNAIITPMDYIDILATKDNEFIRVQVKAAMLRENRNKYKYNSCSNGGSKLNPNYVDILATVALDTRRVIFHNIGGIENSLSIHPEDFDVPEIEKISWNAAIKNLQGELRWPITQNS